ncbi:hypothetical protein L1987_71145 [Smallanthus sonchifolius]|uniref:Uncharacterized protein n=1 Tax=Smallanthus sonchifolius TaxID=185202 RepID=A0ACB9ASZ5_9ASTR|nr:hypothetical protein L1987_71145 [Smallanthus sonchifolius]
METSFHVVGVGFGLGTKAVRRYLANSASADIGLPLIIFAFVGSVLVSVRAPCCMQPSHKKRRRVSPNADGAGPSFVSVDDTGAQTLAQSTLRASLLQSVTRERARAACSLSTSVSASMDPDQLMSATMDLSSPVYMDLGDCTNSCEFCGALFWFAERLLSFPLHCRPKYSICCRAGRVSLQFPIQPPDVLKELLSDSILTENVRLMRSDVLPIDKDAIQTFSNWLLDVGDGRVGVLDKEGQIDVKRIEIPPEFVLEYTETALAELIHAMYQAMEAKRIASLKLRADGLPIEVRVLRNPAVNVVSHSVHLRIGTATAVDSIPDTDVLPHHYFELCDYEKLDTLRGDSHQLIDFIGLLQGMEEKTTKDHNPFLNLTLTNESFKSDSGSNRQTKLQQMAGKKTLAALEENTVTIAELLQKQQQELAVRTLIYKITLSYKISTLLIDVKCLIHKNDQNCIT